MNPEMLIGLSRAYTEFEHDCTAGGVLHAQGDHFCGGIELDVCAESLMTPTGEQLVPEGHRPMGYQDARVSKPVIMVHKGTALLQRWSFVWRLRSLSRRKRAIRSARNIPRCLSRWRRNDVVAACQWLSKCNAVFANG